MVEEIIEGVRSRYIDKVLEDNSKLFKGAQKISWKRHIQHQAAAQKHVDSSISKTINMPYDATVEDVKEAYEYAWKEGCKGVTVYRDGSRSEQVLTTKDHTTKVLPEGYGQEDQEIQEDLPTPYKLELPDELEARRYRVKDNEGTKVYVTVGHFDEEPVEIFVKHPYEKANSYLSTISRLTSLAMRYMVPLDDITKSLRKGSSSVADMPAKIARILDKYKKEDERREEDFSMECPDCSNKLTPDGGCWTCYECGWSKCT